MFAQHWYWRTSWNRYPWWHRCQHHIANTHIAYYKSRTTLLGLVWTWAGDYTSDAVSWLIDLLRACGTNNYTYQCWCTYTIRLRGWRNAAEIVLFEISNSMKPYPYVCFTHIPVTWKKSFFGHANSKRFPTVFRQPLVYAWSNSTLMSWAFGFAQWGSAATEKRYGQSPHQDSGFQRVWHNQHLNVKGCNSLVHGELPGSFESSNLSRDTLRREIGRSQDSLGKATSRDISMKRSLSTVSTEHLRSKHDVHDVHLKGNMFSRQTTVTRKGHRFARTPPSVTDVS